MARKPRSFQPGVPYHVMNRAAALARIFRTEADYLAFEHVLAQAVERFGMRVLSYVLMPNHFHLVLWPPKSGAGGAGAGDAATNVSAFMKWLQQTHTQRWHARHPEKGAGRLYQGRFKAFPIQPEFAPHGALQKVCRYVERNPLRAHLVQQAQQWRWSALWQRIHSKTQPEKTFLTPWPPGAYPGHRRWTQRVNGRNDADDAALQTSIKRGRPLGEPQWVHRTIKTQGLEHTIRPQGRPRKSKNND